MIYKTSLWLYIFIVFFGESPAFGQSSAVWHPKERSSLGGRKQNEYLIQKLIRVPLDSDNLGNGYFDLYYYIVQPANSDNVKKRTVLYVAGGPGQVNRFADESYLNFFFKNDYQVVFFHLRGSGFSQLPPSNKLDRFIRTRHAVRDIEAIRQDLVKQKLLGANGKWDAVVGWSYGTILAQEYTNKYSMYVNKLVLIGSQSRHMFVRPKTSFDDVLTKLDEEARGIQRKSFNRILQLLPEFSDSERNTKNQIKKDDLLNELFGEGEEGIVKKTERLFGNIQFVIENYCNLRSALQKNKLHYSRAFFQNLRDLRNSGSVPLRSDRVINTLTTKTKILINELRQGPQKSNTCNLQIEEQENHRNFFVMTAYDGINARFLKEWLSSNKKDFRDALRRSAGTTGLIPYVYKVGIADDVRGIKAWDPRHHSHSVPTLILAGSDDPVSAGGAAEAFFNRGLTGPRTFIKLPGVGHQFGLPAVDDLTWDGIIMFDSPNIAGDETVAAIGSMLGAKIDPKFRLTLESSDDTRDRASLNLIDFGVLRDDRVNDMHKARENIVALFKNNGTRDVQVGSTDWILKTGDFSATVRFLLTRRLKPQEKVLAFGTIIDGKRTNPTQIKVESPGGSNGRNPDLSVPCVRILNNDTVQAWFHHNGAIGNKPIPADEERRFSFSNGNETRTIIHKINQLLEPGQGAAETFVVYGMTLGMPDHKVEIVEQQTGDHRVFACIPAEETTATKLTMILWNSNANGRWKSQANRMWRITNDVFTAYINVEEAVDIQPNGMLKVVGTVYGVRVHSPVTLFRPDELKDKIEWLATNVLTDNQVSVLIKNSVAGVVHLKDWKYDLGGESQRGACHNPDGLRDCLLYTFIDMDKAKFQKSGISSVVKETINKAFLEKEGFSESDVKIQHCSGPGDAPENCKVLAQ